jgi:hypothetical protein
MPLIRRCFCRSIPMFAAALSMSLPWTAATPAPAADNYVKVIPSTALGWCAASHMGEASEKLQKMVAIVGAPVPGPLDEFKKESGIAKGLDEKGAGGFFVVPGNTAKAPTVSLIFVAITDEKTFLDNFIVKNPTDRIKEIKTKTPQPKTVFENGAVTTKTVAVTQYAGFRNGYAVIAEKAGRAALEAALDAKQDISAEMAGLESWLAENDGTAVGTAAGIKFAAKQAHDELQKEKDNDNAGAPPEALAVLRTMKEFYGKAIEAAPSEFSLAMAGFRSDKEGSIRLSGRVRLVDGGQVSKAVAGIPPVKENLLAGIPGGPFVFACGGLGVPKLTDGYMGLLQGLLKSMQPISGMSPEDVDKATKESAEMLKQMHSMNVVMKTGKRGDPIYSNISGAIRVENSQRLLDLQEKYAESTGKQLQTATKQLGLKATSVKKLEIAGKPALQQEMEFEVPGVAGPAGPDAGRALLDAMLGVGGKTVLYYVAAEEHTVLMGLGVSQERMKAALDILKQPRKSLAEDADVGVTAAMLPSDAQWVAYLSPRGYVHIMQQIMSAAMQNQPAGMEFSVPDFPRCPPVGVAVKATPSGLDAELAVPSSVVKAMGDYVKEMQAQMMRRFQQQNPGQAPGPAPAP